jgi:hypothetical protein
MPSQDHFSNPEFEPSDAELSRLVEQAFAGVKLGLAPPPLDPEAAERARRGVAQARAARKALRLS